MKIYFYTFILPIKHNVTLTQHQLLKNSQRKKTSRIQLDRIAELIWDPELTKIAVQIQDKFKPVIQGT